MRRLELQQYKGIIYMSLPNEIKSLPHWTTHKNKRPELPPDQWSNACTYEQVKAKSDHIGLLAAPAEASPYLLIDIDYPGQESDKLAIQDTLKNDPSIIGTQQHLDLIEPTLASIRDLSIYTLITQTYTEFSPSLTGLRMIIKSQDKHRFPKAYKKAKVFKGQIDFKDQFMTITEIQFPGSPSVIAEVPLLSMTDAFGFSETKVVESVTLVEQEQAPSDLPAEHLVRDALKILPLDKSERLQALWKDITGEQYEHYFYWLSIGMALHHYAGFVKGSRPRMYLAFLQWSETDSEAYTGESDVESKWASFSSRDAGNITWRTILKLANRLTFDYPRPIRDKKGTSTGSPMVNEYANFNYLLEFYGIKLHEDEGFFVSGEREICENYFQIHGAKCWFDKFYGPLSISGLQAATLRLCQDSKWRGLMSTGTHVQTWIQQPREDMDLFKLWLDTPFEELPYELQTSITTKGPVNISIYNSNSTIDYIFECLNVQYDLAHERALAKSMLKKTFMQMIKFREDLTLPFTDNGGMLILIGAENTYKSTFFKLLLPAPLNYLRKEMNMQVKGDKSIRDFVRYLGKKTIVQIDEFEGMMDQAKHGSMFKAIISGDSASMVDIYQTSETEAPRRAIIVGTSNEMKQTLSDNGSRRMWFIKVNKIDTTRLLHINLHKFYRDLRNEFRTLYDQGIMPWLLTQDEIDLLYKMNEQVSARSDLAIWLNTIWPIDEPMPPDYISSIKAIQNNVTGKLYTTPEIASTLMFSGMPQQAIKLAHLERALERHCGKYTHTLGKTVQLTSPKAMIANGRLHQSVMPNGKYKYQKWVMPPKAITES